MADKLQFDDAAFQAQLNAIYQKLWDSIPQQTPKGEPIHKPARPALQWEVTTDERCSIDLNRNTVSLSAGLLSQLKNEAQVAGLLALVLSASYQKEFRQVKEIWNNDLNAALKESSVQTEVQIGAAAVNAPSAVQWLRKSGYNTAVLAEYLGQDKVQVSIGSHYGEQDHFLVALEGINHALGTQKIAAAKGTLPPVVDGASLSADIQDALSQHFDALQQERQERFDKAKEQWDKYDALPFKEKCNLLAGAVEIFGKAEEELPFNDKDIAERIKGLNLKTVSDDDRPYTEQLIKAVLQANTPSRITKNLSDKEKLFRLIKGENTGATLYDALVRAETGEDKKLPKIRPLVGTGLKQLDEKIQEFTKATDEAAIQTLAGEISQLLEEYPVNVEAGARLRIKGFSWPEGIENQEGFVDVPWAKHMNIASREVDEVLNFLGAGEVDPRLWEGYGSARHLIIDRMPMTVGKKEFYIQQDGQITTVALKGGQQFLQAYAQKLAEEEKQMIANADWSGLQGDFRGFIGKYAPQLAVETHIWKTNKGVPFEEIIKRHAPHLFPQIDEGYRDSRGKEPRVDIIVDKSQPFMEKFLEEAGKIQDAAFKTQFAAFLEEQVKTPRRRDMPANHPYVGAYFGLDVISEKDKYAFLHHLNFWGEKDGVREWQFPFMDKLGYSSENVSLARTEAFVRDKLIPNRAPREIEAYVAHDTVKRLEKLSSMDEIRMVRDLGALIGYSPFRGEFYSKVSELVTSYTENALQKDDIGAQLELYTILASEKRSNASAFDEMPELRNQFEARFKAHITEKLASNSPEDQRAAKAMLEALMQYKRIDRENGKGWDSTPTLYTGVSLRTDFGNWVADTYLSRWAKDFVAAHGKGVAPVGGLPAHSAAFSQAIDKLENTLLSQEVQDELGYAPEKKTTAAYFMSQLFQRITYREIGNTLLLQQDNAEYLERKIDGYNQQISNDGRVQTGTAILDNLIKNVRYDENKRDMVKHFLLSPYSDKSAQQIVKAFEHSYGTFPDHLSKEKRLEQVKDGYEKFWQLNFGERTAAMALLLGRETGKGQGSIIQEVMSYAIPRPHLAASNRNEMLRAREIATAYIQSCSDTKGIALLSAVLVANPPGKEGEFSLSVGNALKQILGELGPAGDKLMQAIESYPGTPADIRQDLQDAKTKARDLSRDTIWNMVERSNKEVPQPGHKIVQLGEVLGAGSYGVTVKALREDGKWVARTLLYSNGHEQAESEFQTMKKTMDVLVKRDQSFYGPLSSLVGQAANMLDIEMDMGIAEKQMRVAEKLYSTQTADGKTKPIRVDVDGVEVHSFAAPFLGRGNMYKDTEIIEGKHFLDMVDDAVKSRKQAGAEAEKTPAEKDVQDVAAALLTMELSFLLRGLPVDHDRHGGQQCIRKIEENGQTRFEVGQFDFGALETEACNDRQKQMIGYALAGLVYDLEVKNKDFGKALQKSMRDVPQNEQEAQFMAKMQRGVLALGNFVSNLGDDKNLAQILGALRKQGCMDSVVEKAMRDRLGTYADKTFGELDKKAAEAGITIHSNPPQELFNQKTEQQWQMQSAPALGKGLDAIPLTDKQVQAAGVGVAAAAAATGIGVGIHQYNKRKGQQEEQQAQQQPAQQEQKKPKKGVMRRVFRVVGMAMTAAGVAVLADMAATRGQNTRNAIGFVAGDKQGQKFQAKNVSIMGAALIGMGALTTLATREGKPKHEPQQPQNWRQREGQGMPSSSHHVR